MNATSSITTSDITALNTITAYTMNATSSITTSDITALSTITAYTMNATSSITTSDITALNTITAYTMNATSSITTSDITALSTIKAYTMNATSSITTSDITALSTIKAYTMNATNTITAYNMNITSSISTGIITANNIIAYLYDIWVSQSGSDTTGTGSINNPFATINKAIIQANTITASQTPVNINILSGSYSATTTNITRPNVFLIGYGQPIITSSLVINTNNTSYNGGGISNIVFSGSSATITINGSNILNYSIFNCTIYSISCTNGLRGSFIIQNCSTYTNTPSVTVLTMTGASSTLSVSLINCNFTANTTSYVMNLSNGSSSPITFLIQDCVITNTQSSTFVQIIVFSSSSNGPLFTRITNSTIQFTNTGVAGSNKQTISWSTGNINDTLAITNSILICEGSTVSYPGGLGSYNCISVSGSGLLTFAATNVSCGLSGTLNTAVKFPLQTSYFTKTLLANATSQRTINFYSTSSSPVTQTSSSSPNNSLLLTIYPDFPGDIVMSYNVYFQALPSGLTNTINVQPAYNFGSNTAYTNILTGVTSITQPVMYSIGMGNVTQGYSINGTAILNITPTLFSNLTASGSFLGSVRLYANVWLTTNNGTNSISAGSSITATYNNPQASNS